MSDGTHPTYADTTGSKKMFYIYIQHLIMKDDNFNDEDDLSLISDMRRFNIRGNNETSKFHMYWKAAIRVMETESAHGEHDRSHAAGDSDSTNRISRSTLIPTKHIIKSIIHILEKYGLKQCVDFKVQ